MKIDMKEIRRYMLATWIALAIGNSLSLYLFSLDWHTLFERVYFQGVAFFTLYIVIYLGGRRASGD